MIIDIQNKDLEVDLNTAILEIARSMPQSLIVRLINGETPFPEEEGKDNVPERSAPN